MAPAPILALIAHNLYAFEFPLAKQSVSCVSASCIVYSVMMARCHHTLGTQCVWMLLMMYHAIKMTSLSQVFVRRMERLAYSYAFLSVVFMLCNMRRVYAGWIALWGFAVQPERMSQISFFDMTAARSCAYICIVAFVHYIMMDTTRQALFVLYLMLLRRLVTTNVQVDRHSYRPVQMARRLWMRLECIRVFMGEMLFAFTANKVLSNWML
jgi:hypothetical protein